MILIFFKGFFFKVSGTVRFRCNLVLTMSNSKSWKTIPGFGGISFTFKSKVQYRGGGSSSLQYLSFGIPFITRSMRRPSKRLGQYFHGTVVRTHFVLTLCHIRQRFGLIEKLPQKSTKFARREVTHIKKIVNCFP